MPDTPAVPNRTRRAFVAVSALAWLGFFWFSSANPPLKEPDWWGLPRGWVFGHGLTSLIPLLILCLWGLRFWEKRIRNQHLPPHGWAPWAFRVSLFILVLVFSSGWILDACRILIPGLSCQVSTGSLPIRPGPETIPLDKWIRVDWTENCRSTGGTWSDFVRGGVPDRYEAVALRLHPANRPDLLGWTHSREDTVLKKEGSDTTQPWNGEGLLQVVHDLTGKSVAAGSEELVTAYLDQFCDHWSHATPAVTRPHLEASAVFSSDRHRIGTETPPIGGGSQTHQDLRPVWFLPGLCGVAWLAVTAGIYLIARATMGRKPRALQPSL